ncbi:hypothetical protein EUGRSUZ_H01177 [Eucalyptus grandis]|uniref:Uncharacterized protein n=2 Tax=Eucalyptus grandis TaxID=71139 RepID=A0ACC3JPC8_EUCGR|nr:hypothetical protein EUGRSUZ_H01177 [Eucalyptus grandis]
MSASSPSDASQKKTDGSTGRVHVFSGKSDRFEGLTVEIKETMDAETFTRCLRTSIDEWKKQGKKGIWINLPIEHVNLVESAVKEGFKIHHAEENYLMLTHWLAPEKSTIPINASHRTGVGAFVMNDDGKVLVVQVKSGKRVWKLPTGVVNEGEDIWCGAVREVKEETGVDTEFVEVLCFRQSHQAFFTKSDLLFLCVLRPKSTLIKKQEVEIEAAEEFVQQYPLEKKDQFYEMAQCRDLNFGYIT